MVTKDQFLDALRSGDYRQGHCALNESGHYCCLGVYCDLEAPDKWVSETYAHSYRSTFAGSASAIDDRYAIRQFGSMLGLNEDTPFEILFKVMTHLIHRNDGCGDFEGRKHSFNEIADWIENDLDAFVEDLVGDLRYTRNVDAEILSVNA